MRSAFRAAAKARERDLLETQLDACQQAERRAGLDRQTRANAEHLVIEAGAACGLAAGTPEDTFSVLEKWPSRHGEQMEYLAAEQNEWAELQALLKAV
jgi:hypothetical protein